MNDIDVDIHIKKLRNKIWRVNIIKYIFNALFIGSIIFIIFMLTAHFIVIPFVLKKGILCSLSILIGGLILGFFNRPSIKQAALAGDSLGFKQRLITYLEYKDKLGELVKAFKEDVKYALNSVNLVKRYKYSVPVKQIILAISIFFVGGVIYLLPSDTMNQAIEREEINSNIKQETQKLVEIRREIEDELANDDKLSEKDKENIISELYQGEKHLKGLSHYKDAALEISSIQDKINNISKMRKEETIKGISGVFDGLENKNQLVDKLSKYDDNADLIKQGRFTEKEKEKILKNIEKMKNSNEYTQEQQDVLNDIENSITNENINNQLSKVVEKKNAAKDSEEIIEKIDAKLTSMKERLLEKGNDGFEGMSGDKIAKEFTEGNQQDLNMGNEIGGGTKERIQQNLGNRRMTDASGKGGGNVSIDEEGTNFGKWGSASKQQDAVRLGEDESEESFVKGSWQKNGEMIEKFSEQVAAVEGNHQYFDEIYTQFEKGNMNYMYKYKIPLNYEPLVKQYFKLLREAD